MSSGEISTVDAPFGIGMIAISSASIADLMLVMIPENSL